MGRPRRQFESDSIYYVQNFCHGGLARITPTEVLNKIVRGLLLKHATTYKIKIFAYMFLPHRFDMLLQALENNLHRFMCRFQSDLSRALQKYHGIDECIFTTRYIDNPVMEDALEDAVAEILALPCVEDLVAHPSEWPGVSSWQAHQTGEAPVGYWASSEDYWSERRKHSVAELSDEACWDRTAKKYEVGLSLIKPWEELSDPARAEKLEELVRPAVEARAAEWAARAARDEAQKCAVPGAEEARACAAHTRLRCHRARRLRGRCMTACGEAKRKFREQRKQNDERYTNAANRLRRGLNGAYFPAGMIPPGHRFAVGSPGAIWAGENPQDPAEIQAREAAAGE